MEPSGDIATLLIGCGRMGMHHLRLLSTTPGVFCQAIVDPNIPRDPAHSCEATDIPCFADLATYWSATPPLLRAKAAIVASPAASHFALVLDLLQHGIAVLVEKPLALTSQEALQLRQASLDGNTLLMVGHSERFNPAFIRCLDECRRGSIGDIHHIHCRRFSPYPAHFPDCGVAFDMAIHDFDCLQALLGAVRPFDCFATAEFFRSGSSEDSFTAQLDIRPGLTATFEASRMADKRLRCMDIHGSTGMLRCNFLDKRLTLFGPGVLQNAIDWLADDSNEELPLQEFEIPDQEPLMAEHHAFFHGLRCGQRPDDSLEQAYLAVECLERCLSQVRNAVTAF